MINPATLEDLASHKREMELSKGLGLHAATLSNDDIERWLARDAQLTNEIQRLANDNAMLHVMLEAHKQKTDRFQEALVAACALLDIQYEGSHQLAVAINAVACQVDTPGNWLTIRSNIERMRKDAN